MGAACAKKFSFHGELVKMLFMEVFPMVREPFRIFLFKEHSKLLCEPLCSLCQHQPACLKVETSGASQQVPLKHSATMLAACS